MAERLNTAALQILRSILRTDPARDFGHARLSALSTLATKRMLTLGALASLERVTPQTTSKVVQALVRDGLAARTRSSHDRRSFWLRITPKGRRTLARANRYRAIVLARHLNGLTPQQHLTIVRATRLVDRALRTLQRPPTIDALLAGRSPFDTDTLTEVVAPTPEE